ncbi:MAG: methylenetetrahydrofolate reductase [NAD(P)H] [Acidimicrobiales bacterium]|nr:methylenetetrahydrofolate reductase [NAD(P)H] [Acidimicrobiales bacterium]
MAYIRDLLAADRTVSFEFFPPKTDEAERQLEKAIRELQPLEPSFVSVTYGAGGSTRERTRDIVLGIEAETPLTAMAHLTCIGHDRAEVVELLAEYQDGGVHNILALAGDPPTDGSDPVGDFRYAVELVELVRESGDFSVGVAAHPEGHPRSSDMASDRRHLAAKLDVADFAITQFFFRAEDHLRMIDELAALGCTTPVIPGIMPVTNARQVQRFAELSGAEFPVDLAERLEAVADDPATVRAIGVEVATELCQRLLDEGVPGLHFYTLNRSTATREIAANLGLG